MRLVSFAGAPTAGETHIGVLVPLGAALDAHTHVCDLSAAYAADGAGEPLSKRGGMRELLEIAEESGGFGRAAAAAASGRWRIALSDVRLLAPINNSEKVVCVGMNYYDHCTEQNFPVPKEPLLFSKFASSLCASGDDLPLDETLTKELDFEVELCIVVGRHARNVPKEEALGYIAGWTVTHDVSMRDLQFKHNGGQWLLGKAGDLMAPIGPSIVTRDEGAAFSDAGNLGVRTFLNGERVQNSNTRELIHTPADVISYASRYFTLKPGDLILTGTPGGVGVFRKPPLFLKDGDVVTCEIDGLGKVTNKVAAIPPPPGMGGGGGGPALKRAKL